jgi:copper resistance protein B
MNGIDNKGRGPVRTRGRLALAAAVALAVPCATLAQEQGAMPMDHGAMPGLDHGTMHDAGAAEPKETATTPDELMTHDMAAMQGGSPPPDARDPHAYSGGYGFGAIPRPRLADEKRFASLLIERLEAVRTPDANSAAYELQGWFGRDYDRLVLDAEGEVADDRLHEARTELLWSHAFAAYWDTRLGLRYDSGSGPDRTWLAAGVQGLAPYWFELNATAYAGDEGRTALRLGAEYELLFTQRLILEPRVETNLYGKSDPKRELGSGVSDVVAGLRLRYEVRRKFAPYVGVEWRGLYGETADFVRAAEEPDNETRWVAGLRAWF